MLARLPIPTRRSVALAAASAPLVLVPPLPPWWTLILLDVVLLAAIAVDAARAAPPVSLRVHRDVPGVLTLNEAAELAWRVRGPAGVRVGLADHLPPSLGATARRAHLVLSAGGVAAARVGLRPQRRGRFELDRVTVRVTGPLGLGARQADLAVPSTVKVHPSFRSRRSAELRLRRARLLEVGLRSARGRGGGTEFESLREYGVDDEFRRIDWAATARAGKAIVREYRAERNQTVVVLLDTGRLMAGRLAHPEDLVGAGSAGGEWDPAGGAPRLDHAMDALLALTTVATHLGDRTGLVAFGAQVRAVLPAGHARDQLRRMSEAIYPLQPELAESDYRGAFAATLARFRRRSLLVLLTELTEEGLTDTLLPALPPIARDHLVVVGGVRDPRVEGWARGWPDTAGQAYRKAAATGALEVRRRVSTRLHGMGVTVVDDTPDELPGRLVDAYLQIKAAGRL